MRLTEKDENKTFLTKQPFGEMINKLGQLEDIEEEFEIDSIEDLRDRLTKYKFLANHEMSCVDVEAYNLMLKDLNLYRKLEDELGIDLVTLFKAYSNGFYVKGETEKQYIDFENSHNSIALKNGEMFYGHKWCYQYVKLKDYGKTWALTKEELL